MWWLSTLLALGLWQAPPSDPAAEGLKSLGEERWEEAAASFIKAIALDEKNYAHHFNLGFAQSMSNKNAEAVESYRKTLALKPGLYEAELNLGILLLSNKAASAEAARLLEDAARQKPGAFRPVWYAAEALLASGEAGKAIGMFKSALALDPQSKDAELGLARALAKDGKLAESAERFQKLAGSDPDVLLELASNYESAGSKEQAALLYGKFPANPAARERAGELLLELGKTADAIPYLEAAVAQSPTPANRFALGTAYNLTKQYAKAEPLLAQALQSEPTNLDLRLNYARVLREERKYQLAAQEFAKVAQAKPNSAETWGDLAGMLILIENYEQALAALDKVRALGAETAAHHYFRAIVLDKHRMYEPALASYEKFLELSSGKSPDEEFKARQRARIIRRELARK